MSRCVCGHWYEEHGGYAHDLTTNSPRCQHITYGADTMSKCNCAGFRDTGERMGVSEEEMLARMRANLNARERDRGSEKKDKQAQYRKDRFWEILNSLVAGISSNASLSAAGISYPPEKVVATALSLTNAA